MVTAQATRLLTPEEIAVQAGQQVPFLRLPDRASLFAERETRLRQLAAGHAMRDFLLSAAELTRAQQALLQRFPAVAVPAAAQLEAASRAGRPPLAAADWPRAPAWHQGLHDLLDLLLPQLGGSPALAALQVYWTQLVLQTDCAPGRDRPAPFGRTDDPTLCPCCGSRPTASISRIGADASGDLYLHCSLCATQWHMVRIKCSFCTGTQGIGYQSLQALAGRAWPVTGAAPDAVQAETCDECGHYLKIVHMGKDLQVEPVADDLASLTLDLLVSDAGRQRHGVNLLLLFGDPDVPAETPPAP